MSAGFAAPLGQKDIRLTLAAAEELCVPLPLASLLRDRFLTLMADFVVKVADRVGTDRQD